MGSTSLFGADGEVLLDRVVAIVNGKPVLASRVKQKVEDGPLVVVSEFPLAEDAPQDQKALQDAINWELVQRKCRELEIDVRDEEIESEIKMFLESRQTSKEQLLQYLTQQGKTYEDYKDDFRDRMVLRQFHGRVLKPLVKITDKDLETYYLRTSGGGNTTNMELNLRQIIVEIPSGADSSVIEAKEKLAKEVHQKLLGGLDFSDAVKLYSDDTEAREKGGLMEGIKPKDLAAGIREAVENLDSGKFTQPIRSPMGYHLFYMEERKMAGVKDFHKQKERLENELFGIEMNNQIRRWLNEERQKSKIEMIAE